MQIIDKTSTFSFNERIHAGQTKSFQEVPKTLFILLEALDRWTVAVLQKHAKQYIS